MLASSPELAAYRYWVLHTRQGGEHLLGEQEFLYQVRVEIVQEADKKEIPSVLLCKNST